MKHALAALGMFTLLVWGVSVLARWFADGMPGFLF